MELDGYNAGPLCGKCVWMRVLSDQPVRGFVISHLSLSGLFRLFIGEVQATHLQQALQVSRLVDRFGLGSRAGFHDLHPDDGGHQNHPVGWLPDRGEMMHK